MNEITNAVVDFDYNAQARYFGFTDAPLPAPRARVRKFTVAEAQSEQAAVLSSTLAAYDDAMTEEDREIFDDTLLYAEIRADKEFSRETQRREWYGAYSQALTMCGWPTINDPYKEYVSQEISFTMDEAALKIIGLVAGVDKLKILPMVSAAFDSLEKNEGAIKLMELKSKKNRSANFQIVPGIVSNGRVQMVASGMQLESRSLITKVLFFKFNKEDVTLFNAATRRTLNRRAYNVVKGFVQETTDKHRVEYFKKGLATAS
jgi:hypothetical protein